MTAIDDRKVLQEVARRAERQKAHATVVSSIRAELFKQQLDFIDDPSRNKGALCTRRAGKTSMWSRYATITALLTSRSITRIWAITRLRAKQLLWDEFKLIMARHRIEADFNETELTVRLRENGSEIRLLGADKDKEVQKKRGDKTIMEVVLEAQLFGPYLRTLVEDVAEPCLFDLRGTFCLEGTPGPVCAGYWFEVSGRFDFGTRWASVGNSAGLGAGWSMHRWSVLDNPFVPKAREELSLLKSKRRWADDNPTYVREWLARWVNDLGALFYRYDPVRNSFDLDECVPWGPGWEHTLGWDLGSRDDMAFVVWGFHPHKAELYEAFSWKEPGALSHRLNEVLEQLEKHGVDGTPFNFVARVADTGGGGKMYVDEIATRTGRMFEAAKKTEKYAHVRLFNDDMLSGFIKIRKDSSLAQELSTLPRDPDWPDPNKPEAPPREDPRFPNHCSDASLYAYRRCWHYLHQDEPQKVVVGTPAFFAKEVKTMEEFALKKALKQNEQAWMYGESAETDEAEDYYEGP